MKNRLYAKFSNNPSVEYPCVLEEPYTDNFNEQLDSMSIILDNVEGSLNLRHPYIFCMVRNNDLATPGHFLFNNGTNKKVMLVDTYVETQVNIQNDIYRYQINLMNTTKLLEKIQCPQLVITHSLIGGSKTIYQKIDEYMKLYSPKIKKTTDGINWDYDYLFDWSGLNVSPFNDHVAADMQMNNPSLRELLTNLMLQVGCIPSMDYVTLGFINFREPPTSFDATNTNIGPIVKSGASDSYANTLIVQPTQVLDTENRVYSESIGFRDRNTVFVKQKENLKLETRYPIYHIDKCVMKFGRIFFWPANVTNYCDSGHNTYPIIAGVNSLTDTAPYMASDQLVVNFFNGGLNALSCDIYGIKAHLCRYNSVTGKYEEIGVCVPSSGSNTRWTLGYDNNPFPPVVDLGNEDPRAQELLSGGNLGPVEDSGSHIHAYYSRGYNYYVKMDLPNNVDADEVEYVWFENYLYIYDTDETLYQFIPLRKVVVHGSHRDVVTALTVGNANSFSTLGGSGWYTNNGVQFPDIEAGLSCDITKLVVEKGRRNLLNTNFNDMTTSYVTNIDRLAEFLYGTVGYAIGNKEITGFSDTYDQVPAGCWWNITKTYFDNMLDYLVVWGDVTANVPVGEMAEDFSEQYGNMPVNSTTLYAAKDGDPNVIHTENKSDYVFDITYQPLNTFKMKVSKEQEKNIPLEIHQLNESADGLSDYTRMLKYNIDTVNRIGNEVIQIPQRELNFSKINPLNSKYHDSIVFQRKFTLAEDFVEVLYSASEKAVMKNYFTSIIQKYRSYEYVDYSQSVVRKECDKIYCLLSQRYYNTDDKIVWGPDIDSSILISGLIDQDTTGDKKILYNIQDSYEAETLNLQSIKNEVSVLTHDTGFAVNYEDYDNVSAGTYFPSRSISLGGLIQKWQVWDQNTYNLHHKVSFAHRIKMATYDLDEIAKFPIITNTETKYLFTISSNDSNYGDDYVFYKDNAEIINHTVQFEFYSDEDVRFTENFIRHCHLVGRFTPGVVCNAIWAVADDYIMSDIAKVWNNEVERQLLAGKIPDYLTIVNTTPYYIQTGIANNHPYIDINWSLLASRFTPTTDLPKMERIIVGSYIFGTDTYRDFISFPRPKVDTTVRYYLSLNDNKSLDVWYFQDGELFTTLQCKEGNNRKCN